MTTRILKRIISTNFSVSANKILSLSFGYFAGTVLYASVIYQLYVYKFLPIDESQVPSLTIASALCFCFTARVISREYGYANGKQYLAALGASASIIFIINTVIYINSIDTSTIIYAIYHIPTLFTYLYSKILNLVAAVLILSKSLFGFIVVGILSSASVGELLLEKSKAKNRSITAAFEKFDLAFVPIPTRVKSNTKIMEMINDEVSKNKLK